MMFKDLCDMGAVCNACNTFVMQSRKAGYTNLQAHLVRNHPGYDTVMKLVVHKNFTLADVDDPTIRDAVRFDSIGSKTLKARMIAAVKLAELDMCAELKGEKYVLVFDGVTDACEHSLAVFAVTKKGARFLALSTFMNEQSMTADEHIRFLDMILTQYGLLDTDLVAIVCDNMETNKAISRRIIAPMIGCAAHRFNLAVREYVAEHSDVIDKVATHMRKLKTVKRIALLKANKCKYKPVPMHELRWSGLHRMLKRYKQHHPFLYLFERDRDVDCELPADVPANDARRFPIVNYLPNASEHCCIMDLLEDMELLELATKRLQSEDLTVISARDIFDEVLVDFPQLKNRLKVGKNER
ncbi:hypothetical protein F442_23126 [Phytophthora nicotianae P10297]|uniref:BED-type domain-containing protein n=1 Tax=Phytophthora nicotianae P10297 TaxID=1317064 RepID=W2XYJ1_PHYNI|nr:hypothetical protein F442_23126 [Phytophthora nicotianae P10297]